MYVDGEEYGGVGGFESEAEHDAMNFRTVMQHGREEDEDVTEYERRLELLLGGTRQPRDKARRMRMSDAAFVEADSPDEGFSRFGTIRGMEA